MAVYRRPNSKFWQYKFECGGKTYRGSTKETLKTRAEKFERRERLAIETGQTNLQQGVRTYGQMMDRYEPPASMRSAYRVIKAAIPAATPHTSIVARAHEWRDARLAEGYSPCTINRKLAIIKRVLNLAYKEWEWIPVALGPKIVKCSEVGTEREVYLTMEELEDAATCMSEVAQAALWIAAFTGLRRGNVLGLQPENWDRETKRLIIPARMTKSSKPIALPVPQSLWSTMDMLPLQIDDWGLRQEWDKARHGMGWDHADNRFGMPVRWHDLRHTFASLMLSTGAVNMGTLRDIMGHCSVSVTNRYSHLHADHHKAELDSAFDSLGINKPKLRLVQ
jgi:integrase